MIGTKISFHIILGGKIDDKIGCFLVKEFVEEFLSIPEKYKPRNGSEIHEFKCIEWMQTRDPELVKQKIVNGELVFQSDLEFILKESINSLMPNIWVHKGGPIVAPTLMFLEPTGEFGIGYFHGIPNTDNETRIDFLKIWSRNAANELKTNFIERNKFATVNIKSDGTGMSMEAAKKELEFPLVKIIIILTLLIFVYFIVKL
jgi:hypothetical protein